MGETLRLRVLTPAGAAVETEAESVVLPGYHGELGILPSHTPYLALTVSGLLSWQVPGGKRESVAIRRGLAEVRDDAVKVLTDEGVLRPGDLDAATLDAREKAARQRLEEALDRGEQTGALEEEVNFLGALRGIVS